MTTLFGPVESAEFPIIEAVARRKHGWLPILTVLFLISYALMTFLIVEQGRTIESQRTLIRELLRDSTELSAVKMKAPEGHAQTAQGQSSASANQASHIPSAQGPSSQTQSLQNPSTQAQAKQAPSSQAGSHVRTQRRAAQQKPFRMPSRPESDLMDSARSLITI